jgi:hypothetical protein
LTSNPPFLMEKIPILYRMEGDADDNLNYFELEVFSSKEILLFDILKAWLAWNPIGIRFVYFARTNNSSALVLLESPASCVPVINGSIYLVLKSSGFFPFTPNEQALAYFEKSQRDIYGTSTMPQARPKPYRENSISNQKNSSMCLPIKIHLPNYLFSFLSKLIIPKTSRCTHQYL